MRSIISRFSLVSAAQFGDQPDRQHLVGGDGVFLDVEIQAIGDVAALVQKAHQGVGEGLVSQ